MPLVVSDPNGEAAATYSEMARAVAREVRALGTSPLPQWLYLSEMNAVQV